VARRQSTGSRAAEHRARPVWRSPLAVLVAAVGGGLLLVVAALGLSRPQPAPAGPAPVARVATSDVHALAFLGGPHRVLLGHHGGIFESLDGGRTWRAWGSGSDAMALGVAADESVVVGGHDVLATGRADGQWQEIENDLPSTDIHGLARDPSDPRRMWAYLATGGVYESTDGGSRWQHVFDGHAFGLIAVAAGQGTRLVAVDPEAQGLVASDDGGRTWQVVGPPPTTPIYALAGANRGDTLLFAGGGGLFRSDDAGRSFALLIELREPILAAALTEDGSTIVIATRDRAVYRSEDGGRTWPGGLP
jgi:photosystem II stability/assembly factor-like uncharacterized protein